MKIKWPHSHKERGRTLAEGRWNQPAPARVDVLGTNVPNAVPRASPSRPYGTAGLTQAEPAHTPQDTGRNLLLAKRWNQPRPIAFDLIGTNWPLRSVVPRASPSPVQR